ncbi:MAG: zinc-ribbon domain-containing protein [Candidatus Heimdallarchaeota archaeon]|nr:zinc-ribbon domain-containing protein [Candidatus Heimdallarchaeota archaeon]MBY8995489.1 zinc-ribbon domain-containing protein [Candidatus Heimdallarchaeota archaeon]
MSKTRNSATTGNFWTIAIGIMLLAWGTVCLVFWVAFNNPSIPGSPWLMLPGGIMIVAAISNIITYRYNREKILGALQSYERVSIEQLSSELSIKEKDVKNLIVDLRSEGKLKASFDPESGDVFVLDVKGQPPVAVVPVSSSGLPEHETAIKKTYKARPDQGFCPYCGSLIKPGDKFCNNCGASID